MNLHCIGCGLRLKTYLKKFGIPLSVTILVAGLAWIWFTRLPVGPGPSSPLEAAQVGFLAPDFTLSSLDFQEVRLANLKGKPVVLNFWASWCPPCKAEMSAFQEAFQEFGGSDLQIIAINATNQDSLTEVTQFIEEYEISFPIPLDQSGAVSRDYLVHSLPTTYFIDRAGVIKEIIIGGPIPLSLLRIQASQLLAE
jgi:cytochrome c biogenesis protein CcmG/thiol:disulfide interchange protein DsbE